MSFFRNTLWSLTNKISIQFIGIVTNVILANLLYPEIFGLLGMAVVFTGFVLVLQEAGLSSYIIYQKNLKTSLISTTFWLNIFVSIVFIVLLILLAKPISNFYQSPDVEVILKYIAVGVLFGSFGITSRALLMKGKQFKILTYIDGFAEIVASISAIIFALSHNEFLAITARLLVRPFIQSAILVFFNRKQILGRFYPNHLKEILPYSTTVLGTRIFTYINKNIDYLLIGRLLGSKELGLYYIAFQWSMLARQYISGSIASVFFPEISAIKDDLLKIKSLYLNMINKLAMITFPLCLGLLFIAPEFIEVFYGEQWREAVPVLQVLMIVGLITSIGTVGGEVFKGVGRPGIEMKLSFFSLIFFVIAIYIGAHYSIIGVAIALLIRTLTIDTLKIHFVMKLINCEYSSFLKALWPSILTSTFMIFSLVTARFLMTSYFGAFVNLMLLTLIGGISYTIFMYFFNKQNLIWLVGKMRKKRTKPKTEVKGA